MKCSPPKFRDEVQALHDFISETQTCPENFRSFHWMISTGDRKRVADSSAISGGPVNMSQGVSRIAPFTLVFEATTRMLSLPYIYAVDMPLVLSTVRPRDVLSAFGGWHPDELLIAVASGRRLQEPVGWSLSMVYVGLTDPDAFLNFNRPLLATTKPLVGERLYSNRFVGS